ncbi:MAG: class I SAM-dependent DNA methyltransferase [Candidatus Hydrogenedentes bacterium]|nr:class I SAM-dependent DNA methyltransferase [Candidatus Hydrogenedentota bacterium]
MPSLSWNEIRHRAIQFAHEYADATDERREAQSFWNDFFGVFGIKRRLVASFEEPVKSLKDTWHFIDLFWKGKLLAEHKSAGRPLDRAGSQAFNYIQELKNQRRDDEIPRYIVLSDFQRIVLHDLEPEPGEPPFIEFPLEELHRHVKHFAFLIGQKTHRFGEEDEANLQAAALMADLHDAVADGGYPTEFLERMLVRLLFCLFADDTGIFETAQFDLWIHNRTREDGSDLGPQLNHLFEVLNTPPERRGRHLEEDLAAFPYINGQLFADHLPTASFSRDMRNRLAAACRFDWSRISPAIFGSLFQGIMDKKERRQIGAHYTSERDILKVIRPLFLDALREEFGQIQKDSRPAHRNNRLEAFQLKLRALKFLDPACGCGNFLVIAYRELRRLELDVLNARHHFDRREQEFEFGEVSKLSLVDVDQFYGIEIGEWPARIAETALWLTDHQMNTELSLSTGNMFQRIPLEATPHIQCANALRMDWNDLLPAEECAYVLGNPPFIGAKWQTTEQRSELKLIAGDIKSSGLLDYVTLWYFKAARYIQNTAIRCAFVSTNSITQGEQVGVFWSELRRLGIKIHFAHRTFSWQSEAKGKAHVHVVIIGFGLLDVENKAIYDYENLKAEPKRQPATNINPYLVDGPDAILQRRSTPVCDVPRMVSGNKPIDDGNYLMTPDEKTAFLAKEPEAAPYFKQWLGGQEFLNGIERWCLWLGDASPAALRNLPECGRIIEKVKVFRAASKSAPTQKLAQSPRRFHTEFIATQPYLALPQVSSERRFYIPIAYLDTDVICGDKLRLVEHATPYHFGVLTSAMHMAWMRAVSGRLKSDYQYSVAITYNNFPWPPSPSDDQRARVEECAQGVLDARQPHLDNGATLADLYDPLYMPAPLLKAHQNLDRAVDRCYRKEKFETERERVEFLFGLYEEMVASS